MEAWGWSRNLGHCGDRRFCHCAKPPFLIQCGCRDSLVYCHPYSHCPANRYCHFLSFARFALSGTSPPPLPSISPDYQYPNGAQYYGALQNGLPTDGRAIVVFPTGNRYDGELQQGKRNGCGTYTFKNGRRYVGQFKQDQFEGRGIWMLGNGDRYVGDFQANQCQGEGIFLLADGSSQKGLWRDGNLIDGSLSCSR
ncbi:MAG: hypothetical protein HC772_05445 [Leptolyngbyaceae cyanobacterium CRU_2_3]|nr:hypothetical protein [Leptolyngbyaceae cyanobacterium CRU_2_3]